MTVEPRPFVHVRAPVRCALALAAVVLAGASLASAQGVCDRTPAVRDAIVDATGGLYNCAEITAAHLAAIESLDLTNYGVTTLKAGDFQGMSLSGDLHVSRTEMRTLEKGVFDGLEVGGTLWLTMNAILTTLEPGLFDGLRVGGDFRLTHSFALVHLEAGVFEGLHVGRTLWLIQNPALTTLDAGVFDGSRVGGSLALSWNRSLTTLGRGCVRRTRCVPLGNQRQRFADDSRTGRL